jgi:lysophospholipase L1-like esterase
MPCRRGRAFVAVVLVFAAGACHDSRPSPRPTRVACLGDSNTFALPRTTDPGWCELLGVALPQGTWQVRGFAFLGATVVGEPTGRFVTAADHVAKAEADWHPDVYVLAYGTNDVKHVKPEQVKEAYLRWREALIGRGLRVLIATTPPTFPPAPPSPAIAKLNALLRREIPARDLVDFDSIVEASDYDADGRRVKTRDGIHLNLPAQQKRAEAVRTALLRP